MFGLTHTRPTRSRKDGTTYTYPCPCGARHKNGDEVLGTPIDPATYDYAAAADWNAKCSRLLAVTMQRLSRLAYGNARTSTGRPRQLQWVRVAEFQRRGLVHFHVIVRGHIKEEHLHTVVRGTGTPGETGHIKPTTSHGIGWGHQCDVRRVVRGSKHGVGYYLLKVVGYATKNAGSDSPGLNQHEWTMAKAGAESCACKHPLTCSDGPDEMVVTIDDHGNETTLTVSNLSKRRDDRCVRHRLARRGWGFRGHIFAASGQWGVTLREIRERRTQHHDAQSQPTLRAFLQASLADPSLPVPPVLVEWSVERASPARR